MMRDARTLRLSSVYLALVSILVPGARSQNNNTADSAAIAGTVCDSQNHPIADAAVLLESNDHAHKFAAHSDSQGRYRFEPVPSGTYAVHASRSGYRDTSSGPIVIRAETKSIDLDLPLENAAGNGKDNLSSVEFSNETQFNVAGVTDPSNLGGHGSDVALRTKESLAKDTASLKNSESHQPKTNPHSPDPADSHERLAEIAETEGRPLDAVHEYQRAAELQPTEPHLFAWGADLLLHRAFEPAIEVFSRGHHLYPESVRMLLGLSVATYDQGAGDQGKKLLLEACDLNPPDPTPYLFLGKLQETEKIEIPAWTKRFQRFAGLHPENASAHYYYAVALDKHDPASEKNFSLIESELKTAVQLDPQFGDAYTQLGILYSQRGDVPAAISAFQKAIAIAPLADEAHYRLAQIYGHLGQADQTTREIELFRQASEQNKNDAERERHKIQQFVYTLRSPNPTAPPPAPPH
jgi:Tfp pilus assembly protein PilF